MENELKTESKTPKFLRPIMREHVSMERARALFQSLVNQRAVTKGLEPESVPLAFWELTYAKGNRVYCTSAPDDSAPDSFWDMGPKIDPKSRPIKWEKLEILTPNV